MEIVFDPEEEYYFLRPKPQTESEPKDNIKDIIKTKATTEAANPPSKPKMGRRPCCAIISKLSLDAKNAMKNLKIK